MKLSEAIRLGSMLGPQVHGMYFGFNNSSCAIGAAMRASGTATHLITDLNALAEKYPILWKDIDNPILFFPMSIRKMALASAIFYMNDTLHWTREEIANFVEEVENGTCERETELSVNV